MAWYLVTKDSRFSFSHEFSPILLSQFESWLKDEDITFRYRRSKNTQTGWMDSNLFQYLFRPRFDQFEAMCVWEYFKHYQMRLISSLSSQQKENLENDYEDNRFFKFDVKYPGYHFACLEEIRNWRIPMLYYKDNIPDLELCKIGSEDLHEDIDLATENIRNEYATKILLLFYPFREKDEFPIFQERWEFFNDVNKRGLMYCDSAKIM
jgi:hypothetical protein